MIKNPTKVMIADLGPNGQATLVCDPNDVYHQATPQKILDAVGVLLYWALEGAKNGEELYAAMADRYPYPTIPSDATIDEAGRWTYPGDPSQSPLLELKTFDEIVRFYRNAQVAVTNRHTGETSCTRMD